MYQNKKESIVVKTSYVTSIVFVVGYFLKENGYEIPNPILEAIVFLVLSAVLPVFYAWNNPERNYRV
jgi:hypothetical protein